MIEAEVHSSLRAFLRSQGQSIPTWHHHLTMARLVARALRLGRSALIQTGTTQERYRLSYLAPALLWSKPVILVAPEAIHHSLVERLIPQLQHLSTTPKDVRIGNRFPDDPQFQGLLITSPDSWLGDRLEEQGRFPLGIPTLIDGADDLEEWTRHQLTTRLHSGDWDELMSACPEQVDRIRDVRVQLAFSVFQHPPNPYECCLIDLPEQEALRCLFEALVTAPIPARWQNFWHHWQKSGQIMWAAIARPQGQFSLSCAPVEVATSLQSVWKQPVVIMGGALDLDAEAKIYRTQLGLGDMTCLKFDPARQDEMLQLYLPDRLPMPNTPQFQNAFLEQVRMLLNLCRDHKPVVLLIGDVPLRARIAAILAGEFGSRVQVETTQLEDNSILVTGWEFWRQHHASVRPQLLAIATLPIPSLENPLVAGRVAYYKQQRQDWFRLYLLPVALRELQRAIAPVRQSQGIIALLDSRVNHRSYGSLILSALSPLARTNYLDPSWFGSRG